MPVRANAVAGSLTESMGPTSTTMVSEGLVDLPAISGDFARVTVYRRNSAGRVTAREVVHVTAHGSGAMSATVQRAREGTTAGDWVAGDRWDHAVTAADLDGMLTKTEGETKAGATLKANAAIASANAYTDAEVQAVRDYADGQIAAIVAAEGWTFAEPLEWDAATEYPPRQVVDDDGGFFVSLTTTTGDKPTTNPSKWGAIPTAVDADFRSDANDPDTGFVRKPDADAAFAAQVRLPLNAKDLGAIADGDTHPLSGIYSTLAEAQEDYPDAAALTEEVDAAAVVEAVRRAGVAGGAHIYLPTGTYRMNVRIRLPSNVTLQGAGRSDTVLLLPDGTLDEEWIHSWRMVEALDVTEVSICDLTLDWNRYKQVGGQVGQSHAMRYMGVKGGTIRNVTCTRAKGDGFYIGGDLGIEGTQESESLLVEGLVCDDNNRHGMNVGGLLGGTFTGCAFRANQGTGTPSDGVSLEPTNQWKVNHVTFTSCRSHDNARTGLMFDGINVQEVDINGCHFFNNGSDGLRADNGEGVRILGGSFHGNAARGIGLSAPANRVSIIGAQVFGNVGSGVESNTLTEHVVIQGCDIHSNGGRGIYVRRGAFLVIIGCNIRNEGQGIQLDNNASGDTRGITIMGCIVSGCDRGIRASLAVNDVRVIGNQVEDSSIDAIFVRGARWIVQSNTSKDNTAFGIDLNTDATDCHVSDNMVAGNGSAGIRVRGARNSVTDNHLLGNVGAGVSVVSGSAHHVTANRYQGNGSTLSIGGSASDTIVGHLSTSPNGTLREIRVGNAGDIEVVTP